MFAELARRLLTLIHPRRFNADLDEEMRLHRELREQEQIEGGLSPDEAHYAAQRRFGNDLLLREESRDMWGWNWLENLAQDIRYGLRMLVSNPGFTTVAVLTLALGIGANTAIFSLLNAVMLRELAVESPNQLVLLGRARAAGSTSSFANTELYSYAFYRELRQKNQVFSDASAVLSLMFEKMHGAVGSNPNLEPMNVQLVSGSYFDMLGVKPALGRAFSTADDEPAGGHPEAILSYSWWERRFERDPYVLGKTVRLGSTVYTIIGVAPPDFFGTSVGQAPEVWIPLSMEKQVSPGWNGLDNPQFQSLYILARLKPGVRLEQAQADINLLARRIWLELAGSTPTREDQQAMEHAHIIVTPAARGLSRLRFTFSMPLLVLTVVAGLVLLIACANIANLLLARSAGRQREIAVRLAIGAGRTRLVLQMVTESLLLAFLGGILGVLFAGWASRALLAMVSAGSEPLSLNVAPDARLFAFTFLVSLLTALLFGMAPALHATRIDLIPALKEGRGTPTFAGRHRLSQILIVSQVAVSLVLVISAVLFLRTLVKLAHVDTGFNKENVLLFGIDPPSVGYKEDSRLVHVYQQIEQRVNAEPGVRAASVAFFTFNQGEWTAPVSIGGHAPTPENDMSVTNNVVGPGYFKTMGIPLRVGRAFGPLDTEISPKVAVINETMARWYFPEGSPIGRHFGIGADPKHSNDIEVVGVVKDAKYDDLRERPFPAAFYPYTQRNGYYFHLAVRFSGDPKVITTEVRRAVREVDRDLPVAYQSTLAEQVDRSIAGQSLIAKLCSFFGLLAVALACVGIFGLMSYAVSRRTNEIGIRMALGAARSKVLWMVMGESLALVGLGFVIGLPAAAAADRLVSKMLYGLRPTDPMSFLGATMLLLVFALFAGYLPARRASRVDPMVALRYE